MWFWKWKKKQKLGINIWGLVGWNWGIVCKISWAGRGSYWWQSIVILNRYYQNVDFKLQISACSGIEFLIAKVIHLLLRFSYLKKSIYIWVNEDKLDKMVSPEGGADRKGQGSVPWQASGFLLERLLYVREERVSKSCFVVS